MVEIVVLVVSWIHEGIISWGFIDLDACLPDVPCSWHCETELQTLITLRIMGMRTRKSLGSTVRDGMVNSALCTRCHHFMDKGWLQSFALAYNMGSFFRRLQIRRVETFPWPRGKESDTLPKEDDYGFHTADW